MLLRGRVDRSLKFLCRLNATRGGLGIAKWCSFNLSRHNFRRRWSKLLATVLSPVVVSWCLVELSQRSISLFTSGVKTIPSPLEDSLSSLSSPDDSPPLALSSSLSLSAALAEESFNPLVPLSEADMPGWGVTANVPVWGMLNSPSRLNDSCRGLLHGFRSLEFLVGAPKPYLWCVGSQRRT